MMNVGKNKELKDNIKLENTNNVNIYTKEGLTFSDEFNKLISPNINSPIEFLSQNFEIDTTYDFSIEQYNYDTKNIENVDAMFFLNISSNSQNVNLQLNDETSVIDATSYKTMEVSKTLGDMLIKASQNNNTLRLDFDNNVTVVLKIASDGKIDTTFFPKDKEVENYLKNHIDYLKSRFDIQSIAYSNISYKPYREGNRKNNRQGENPNE